MYQVNFVSTLEEGRKMIANCLKDGSAMNTFCELLIAQGVNNYDAHRLCDSKTNPFSVLPEAPLHTNIFSLNTGKLVIGDVCFS